MGATSLPEWEAFWLLRECWVGPAAHGKKQGNGLHVGIESAGHRGQKLHCSDSVELL